MSRELRILAWCDLMADHDDSAVEAEPMTIEVDGVRREIDLCDRHRASLTLAELPEVLRSHGRAVSAPASRETGVPGRSVTGRKPGGKGDHVCPFCPLPYGTTFGLKTHLSRDHGLGGQTLAQLLPRCPLCGVDVHMVDHHARTEHGIPWGAVYRKALTDGDPFGVLAPIEARAVNVSR